MTDWRRRRLVQAAASLPLLGFAGARAQDRNLFAGDAPSLYRFWGARAATA